MYCNDAECHNTLLQLITLACRRWAGLVKSGIKVWILDIFADFELEYSIKWHN